ncbi:unnamed protein product [Ambrosiozyma monospora]|uniref:Unnamed protein product n=1 Tax=Ambrosiozyma monospora TaxID=43982 RepID=A0ACB5SVJ3_AMBMO|nr:unnamed protein product [Ambrosiozyma monospora]
MVGNFSGSELYKFVQRVSPTVSDEGDDVLIGSLIQLNEILDSVKNENLNMDVKLTEIHFIFIFFFSPLFVEKFKNLLLKSVDILFSLDPTRSILHFFKLMSQISSLSCLCLRLVSEGFEDTTNIPTHTIAIPNIPRVELGG